MPRAKVLLIDLMQKSWARALTQYPDMAEVSGVQQELEGCASPPASSIVARMDTCMSCGVGLVDRGRICDIQPFARRLPRPAIRATSRASTALQRVVNRVSDVHILFAVRVRRRVLLLEGSQVPVGMGGES